MKAIEQFVKEELQRFIDLPHRAYFELDHSDLLRLLKTEQWTEGNNWIPNGEVFDDYGVVSELGQFADEFEAWHREVAEIRNRYFWDSESLTEELPEDYLSVFGFTSPLTLALDPMLNRCRRIVRRIERMHKAAPEESPSVNLWPAEVLSLKGQPGELAKAMNKSGMRLAIPDAAKLFGWISPYDNNVSGLITRFNTKLGLLGTDRRVHRHNGEIVEKTEEVIF